MPTILSETASFDADVSVPNNTEGATRSSVESTFVQKLVNRTRWAYSILTGGGVWRFKSCADLTALAAVTGAASGDVRLVPGVGLYVFGTLEAADSPWSVRAGDLSGSWVHVLRDNARIARSDGSKVSTPVPYRTLEAKATTEVSPAVLSSYVSTSWGYPTDGRVELTIPAETGDLVLIDAAATAHASIAGATCSLGLVVTEDASGTPGDTLLSGTVAEFVGTQRVPFARAAIREVITPGTIRVGWAVKGSGDAGIVLRRPSVIRAVLIRP